MKKQLAIWIAALVAGGALGLLKAGWLTGAVNCVAAVYTRLFQFIAVPTISLAILTTLSSLGRQRGGGRLFGHTLRYTLTTTFAAALVAFGLYLLISPDNLSASQAAGGSVPEDLLGSSYLDYLVGIFPDNFVRPFLEGNVMSVLLISAAVGLALAFIPESDGTRAVLSFFTGLQEVFFKMIGWLIKILPLGIMAFAAQLVGQIGAGMIAGSLGKYALVVLGGNVIQIFIVLPLFLLVKGINPLKVARAMSKALVVAFFTKSSAGTLPLTISCAVDNLKVDPRTARFVFPICATVNMNGCAAFIFTTSLFVMQNGGMHPGVGMMLLWVVIAVLAAIGNAGVPMGCFFMTLSLMSGIGAPVAIMGLILPIYTIIDMVETTENVWSDCCVCAAVSKDLETP